MQLDRIYHNVFECALMHSLSNIAKQGLTCLSLSDLMDKRLDSNLPEIIKNNWKRNNFNTSDAMYILPDGDVVFSLNDKNLNSRDCYNVPFGSNFSYLCNEADMPSGRETMKLSSKEIKGNHRRLYTREGAKDNEVWNFLARDHKRLCDYVDLTYSETAKLHSGQKIMPLLFGSPDNFGRIIINSSTLGGMGNYSFLSGKHLGKDGLIIGIDRYK